MTNIFQVLFDHGGLSHLDRAFQLFFYFRLKPILRETASLASSAGGRSQPNLPFQLCVLSNGKHNPQFSSKPPASQARQAAIAPTSHSRRFSCFFVLRQSPILRETASLASSAGGRGQLKPQIFVSIFAPQVVSRQRQYTLSRNFHRKTEIHVRGDGQIFSIACVGKFPRYPSLGTFVPNLPPTAPHVSLPTGRRKVVFPAEFETRLSVVDSWR